MKTGDSVETNAAFKKAVSKYITPPPKWTGKVVRQSGEKTWLVRVDGLPRRQLIAEKFLTIVPKGKKR